MRKTLSIIALALSSAMLLCAADVSGVWKAEYTTPDGTQRESTFHLKAEGSTLTGKIVSRTGEAEIKDGSVDGDAVKFTVIRNFNGQEVTLKYSGKVTGDEMKLTVTFNDENTFDIVAKRQTS